MKRHMRLMGWLKVYHVIEVFFVVSVGNKGPYH